MWRIWRTHQGEILSRHGSRVSKVVPVSAWPQICGQFPANTQKYPLLAVSGQTIKMLNINILKHEFAFLLRSLICPKGYSYSMQIFIQKSCGQKDFDILKL